MSSAVPAPRPVLADLLTRGRVAARPQPAVRDAALVIGAALLTAAAAQLSVPLPFSPVPVTGQTFAVLLTGAALGARRGAAGQVLYVLLGAIGLPFYADAAGGLEHVFGATGGYLLAFPIAAALVGALARRGLDRRPVATAVAFLAGNAVIFGLGVPWLAVVADLGLTQAVALGLLPFIPGGIVKSLLAAGLLPAAWRLAGRGTGGDQR